MTKRHVVDGVEQIGDFFWGGKEGREVLVVVTAGNHLTLKIKGT